MDQQSPSIKKSLILPIIITIALAIACYLRVQMEGFSGSELAIGIFALFLLGLPYITLMTSPISVWLRATLQEKPTKIFIFPIYIITVYIIYGWGTNSFNWSDLTLISAYVLFPTAIVYSAPRNSPALTWQDIVFVIAIWIPIDSALIQEVWPWPGGIAKNVYTIPMAVSLATILAGSSRLLDGLDFTWPKTWHAWKVTFACLLIFLAIGLPLGFWTEFIAYNPKDPTFSKIVLSFVLTFFLVAVPEEVLFRGIIQNHLQKVSERFLNKQVYGLIIASIIFGCSHFNNGPYPDWRYIFIASIAGIFYGLSYNRTNSLIPAIIVHTSVDVIWINYFYK